MPANPLGVALRNRRAGHHTLVWARPNLQAPENFTLTSHAFEHGTPIPEKHRGRLRVFQLFALDQAAGLSASFTLDDVIPAIKGHVIGRARLDGTYEIR
jgi:phosphatidylethanolamine-binding protein (PEBP) family uncharacterized protein